MFDKILDLSHNLMSNLSDFASSIIDMLSTEFTIGSTSYTLFTLLFTSAVVIVVTYGIIKFITDIIA